MQQQQKDTSPRDDERLPATPALREHELAAISYIREKTDSLLALMGAAPLKPEELDDETLIGVDPIGIIRDSFAQVLDHLNETNSALRMAHDEMQAILESAEAGILVVDAGMRVISLNRKIRELFGIGQELVGTTCREAVCRGTTDPEHCCFTHIVRSGAPSRHRRWQLGERHFAVGGSPIPDGSGGVSRVVLAYTDITDLVLAEQALRTSEERYRMLVENQNDLVVKTDRHGRFLFVSPSYCSFFGISEAEVIGKRFHPHVHQDDLEPALASLRTLFRSPHTASYEVRARSRNGWRWLSWSHRAIVERRKVVAVVGIGRDITDRKNAEEEIRKLAYYDTLTGLPNRVLLHDRLEQLLAQAARERMRVAVLFLDLDRFKGINDTLGHPMGDSLLEVVSTRLAAAVRRADTVARLGGDEFVIVSKVAQEEDAARVADKALASLAQPVALGNQEVFTSASVGIALYPTDGTTADELLKNADTAMYQAKEQGRGSCKFFSEDMNRRAVERLALENMLRRALERDEFFLVFQPQLDLRLGVITSMEALIRWRHPEMGVLTPATFIPVAEENGLINPIGDWVLKTACRQNRTWHEAGLPQLRVSVNLSPCQFMQSGITHTIASILDETGLAPHLLELELTETTIMRDPEEAKHILTQLKEMGVMIAIDDFGTGYSSLSCLKQFPIDRLKIAHSFVKDITSDPDDAAIAEAIIAMARSMRMRVMAEGVEKQEQLQFLQNHQCDEMQGFYFGEPVPADEFETLLRTCAAYDCVAQGQ